jgi:hypothetical protein
MQRLFAAVIRPVSDAVACDVVVEVGAGTGQLTERLLAHTAAVVHAVDPLPRFDAVALAGSAGERLIVHEERSLSVLDRLGPADLAVLDGDPNWYTVVNELRLLAAAARRGKRPPPVIVVHHVGWPFGRRDGYHDPEAIPLAWRAPCERAGVVPGRSRPAAGGLSVVPFVARRDHQPRCGVRTAIEDFRAEDPSGWTVAEVPGLHGSAVLAAAERVAACPGLGPTLKRFGQAAFLAAQVGRVERERVIAEIAAAAAPEGVIGDRGDYAGAERAAAGRDPGMARTT